ncbi:hypothetical protein [Pseudomonas graminis]
MNFEQDLKAADRYRFFMSDIEIARCVGGLQDMKRSNFLGGGVYKYFSNLY